MQTDSGCINKKTRHLAPIRAQIIEVIGVTSLSGLKEILIGMLPLLQLSSPTFQSHFVCWTEKHKSTQGTPLAAEEQQEPPAQPFPAWIRATGLPTATGASGHNSLNIPWFSTYFVTQIGHLLDKQLNHIKKKNLSRYQLESMRCFICQAGKESLASEPDWCRNGWGEKENKTMLTYVQRGRGKERSHDLRRTGPPTGRARRPFRHHTALQLWFTWNC